jgi:hypothetical protein
MSDENIDTSDIPEATEADFARATLRIPDPLAGDYAIVELFGHQRIIGRVTAKNVYGQEQCQIEPIFDGKLYPPILRGGAALYGVTPCTRERAFALAPKADQWYEMPETLRDVIERPQRQFEPVKPLQFVSVKPEVIGMQHQVGDIVTFMFNVHTVEGGLAPKGTTGVIREIPEPNGYLVDIELHAIPTQVLCGLSAFSEPPSYEECDCIVTTVDLYDDDDNYHQRPVPAGSRGVIRRDRSGIVGMSMDSVYELTILGEGGDNRTICCGPDAIKLDDGMGF